MHEGFVNKVHFELNEKCELNNGRRWNQNTLTTKDLLYIITQSVIFVTRHWKKINAVFSVNNDVN